MTGCSQQRYCDWTRNWKQMFFSFFFHENFSGKYQLMSTSSVLLEKLKAVSAYFRLANIPGKHKHKFLVKLYIRSNFLWIFGNFGDQLLFNTSLYKKKHPLEVL